LFAGGAYSAALAWEDPIVVSAGTLAPRRRGGRSPHEAAFCHDRCSRVGEPGGPPLSPLLRARDATDHGDLKFATGAILDSHGRRARGRHMILGRRASPAATSPKLLKKQGRDNRPALRNSHAVFESMLPEDPAFRPLEAGATSSSTAVGCARMPTSVLGVGARVAARARTARRVFSRKTEGGRIYPHHIAIRGPRSGAIPRTFSRSPGLAGVAFGFKGSGL